MTIPDAMSMEVLSPSDSASAIQQKTIEYLQSGAKLVWIVDPEARTVVQLGGTLVSCGDVTVLQARGVTVYSDCP